eukprot:549723-Pyramimonas_sp.AAC.1
MADEGAEGADDADGPRWGGEPPPTHRPSRHARPQKAQPRPQRTSPGGAHEEERRRAPENAQHVLNHV